MSKTQSRGWVRSLFARRPRRAERAGGPPPKVRLEVLAFEPKDLPSISIPLNGLTWTHIGPAPILAGQAPGNPTATGRVNGIAVDPVNPNNGPDTYFVASDSGGIWRTTDGGKTWSPRTDKQQMYMQAITLVHRAGGDTVYAFDQLGGFYKSTDGGSTFTVTDAPFGQTEVGAVVNKIIAIPIDPADPTKDLLYAAVGSIEFQPPSSFPGGILGSGIWRSADGGATWANIVDSTVAPFSSTGTIPADSLSFSDVAVDPTNPNVVYAAVGNTFGDPTNGVYRTSNALSVTPTWSLLIGGSQFVPGENPGNIKLAVSPNQPSVVFASLALRTDPQTGFAPLLGVFRSQNAGQDWTPMLLANPNSPVNDPNNYMDIFGDDNNFIAVAPNGPTDPAQQTVYVGGFGSTDPATVMISTDSGATWTQVGVGGNGVGTYPNIHDGGFDSRGRLIVATGGGVYRLDSVSPVVWESLNGNPGPNALDVSQFNGFALSPTSADQAVGNDSFSSDLAFNDGPALHNALLFADSQGLGNAAYSWQTVDGPGLTGYVGSGAVIYNPFNPNIVYRVAPGNNGRNQFIRRSSDGGRTWTGVTAGFQSSPFNPGLYTVPLAIDPSVPNRLVSGFNQVQVTDDNGDNWGTSMQVTVTGAKTQIPDLPTTGVDGNHGGPIGITALGIGRQSGIDFGGTGINGVTIFAATEDDATRNATNDPQNQAAFLGPQLYADLIPTNFFPWPPSMTNWNNHSWANITPSDPATGQSFFTLGDTIDQILVDPTNSSTIYVYARHADPTTGAFSTEVFRGTGFGLSLFIDANKNLFYVPQITWTDLTANLPSTAVTVERPQDLALDAQDNVLYVGTGNGVWKLSDPANTSNPTWTEVGLDANNNPTMPDLVPVAAISLNPTTGILGAATYGRGVYEIQVRGLITGHVYTDSNGNGKFDTGEPVFAGVTVEVLDQNAGGAIIASTTTDANGFYQFRSLRAGNYKIVALTNQAGAIQTTGQPADLANFTEQSTDTVDFGFFLPGSISGVKFLDLNGNATRDAGEPGLAGFTIYIDQNNDGKFEPGEPSAVTRSDGSYTFLNLGPAVVNGVANPNGGTYRLREIQQPGYVATVPAAGQALTFTLTTGQAITDANFGNVHPTGGGGPTPPPPVIVAAEDRGGAPIVTRRNLTNGQVLSFYAYNPAFTGGVRVATGFFGGSSTVPDIVAVPGPGGGPHVKVFNGTTGQVIAQFMAYNPGFTGGLYVAVGDINGDGVPDIITGADAGGGPHVKVFDGAALKTGVIKVDESFFAYSTAFTGGVRVSSADVNRDGYDDIVTGAGPGGGPMVQVFSGKVLSGAAAGPVIVRSFFAYDSRYAGGVYVAAADVNGDGFADIATGPGIGGGPHLRVFDGASSGTLLSQGFAFPLSSGTGQLTPNTTWTSGLRVATTDINGDGRPDIIVGPGPGQSPKVRILDGKTLAVLLPTTNVFDPAFLGGIFVAGD